jgi:urease accessory protein
MLQITRVLAGHAIVATALRARARRVILTTAERARIRQRIRLSDGSHAALLLPRGSVMRPGSLLVDERGGLIEVVAAAEQVYRVQARAASPEPGIELMRAAYHLGNRHIPVQLEASLVKLERDPVLREMLVRLGLEVTESFEAFIPESGAYGGGHRHDHDDAGGSLGEQLSREAHGGHAAEADAGHSHDHGAHAGHDHHGTDGHPSESASAPPARRRSVPK